MSEDTNVLSLERIAFLMSTTKKRGQYEQDIQAAADSEELATDFMLLPYYKDKDAAAVRNSINLNIEKKGKENEWPAFTVLIDKVGEDKHVILVNLDVLATLQAEAAAAAEVEEPAQV